MKYFFVLLPLLLLTGCFTADPARPVYALINFSPSIKVEVSPRVQLGGSSTEIAVDERLSGSVASNSTGHSITKDFPFKASVSAPTDVSGSLTK